MFMLRTFVQVLAVALTLVASIFLLRGNLGLSIGNIAELSKTKWGYNSEVARTLAHQQTDTKVGLAFLLLAFALQMVNVLWPNQWVDFKVNVPGAILAITVALLLLLIGWHVSRVTGERYWQEATKILEGSGAR